MQTINLAHENSMLRQEHRRMVEEDAFDDILESIQDHFHNMREKVRCVTPMGLMGQLALLREEAEALTAYIKFLEGEK